MTSPMSARESLYLDFLRSFTALVVVIDHAPTLFHLPGIWRCGHQAVMFFFVLSGYVISHVADTRENTPRAFLVARFARLWSVLIPAMLLTIVCDVIGRTFGHNPNAYAIVPVNLPIVRVGAVLGFLSETWVSIQPLSNGVAWSLCAEFWYYMLFAAWTFLPPGRTRTLGVLVAALLAGHKALLLLPVWLLGVALQRSHTLRRFGLAANVALYCGGLLGVIWIIVSRGYDIPTALTEHVVGPWTFTQLAQAHAFWFDWVFGLAVAAHLLGARTIASWLPLERIAMPIRWCAGVSFAAYLFHMPLLHFYAAFLAVDQGWLAIVLTLVVIVTLGRPVERSKRWWRGRIDQALNLLVQTKAKPTGYVEAGPTQ